MRKELFALLFFAFGFLCSYVVLKVISDPSILTRGDAIHTLGNTRYPSEYGGPESAYLIIDKDTTDNDSSVVFRDSGDARAEIGLIGDNDLHFKTVTGVYGSEEFTDRVIVRSTGEVDNVGTILRQYATTGMPRFAVGDTDGLESGSGVELSYNHAAGVGELISISRGISYRPLKFAGSSFGFFAGNREVGTEPVVSITPDGIKTDGIVGVGLFTVETLPQPLAGGLILVAEEEGAKPVLAYSDGMDWFRSDTLRAYPRPPKPVEEEMDEEPSEDSGEEAEDDAS